ncbi:MAG: hypothetical protein K2N01_03195 [Lachnospiraceae bacterium]|nr:hypothetical protein [Lachnospiraceae bacterium]
MKKTQIIKEIVGKRIEPYGFKYLKTDGPCRIFMREEHGIQRYYDPDDQTVRQYINIQESRYDTILTVRFETDAINNQRGIEFGILRELNPDKGSPWYIYTDEKSYRETLEILANIIVKYGLDFLKSISVEDPIIPTKKMAEELYFKHQELDRMFLEEYNINPVPESEEDIDKWFQVIQGIIIEKCVYPYEDVKELLVKIAAFIGNRACELLEEEWKFPEDVRVPYTERLDFKYQNIFPLRHAVANFRKSKRKDACIFWFEEIVDELKKGFLQKNGLPISNEMISPVDNIGTTDEMYCELYNHHAELAERFQRRMELETECMDEEHINRWFDVIAERMEALHKESYEDAKEELVEIAAFLGVQIERHMDGVWELHINEENDYGRCYVLPSHGIPENILDKVVGGYKLNAIEWIKSECISAWVAWRDTPDDLKYKRT